MNKTMLKFLSVLLSLVLIALPVASVTAATVPEEPTTEEESLEDEFLKALEEALAESDDELLFLTQLLETSGLPPVLVENLLKALAGFFDTEAVRALFLDEEGEEGEEDEELTDEEKAARVIVSLMKKIIRIVETIYQLVKTMQSIGDSFAAPVEPVTEPVEEPTSEPLD